CRALFLFTYSATTLLYILSLHDALPIYGETGVEDAADLRLAAFGAELLVVVLVGGPRMHGEFDDEGVALDLDSGEAAVMIKGDTDRKSTRLNSSHVSISYAVFCLKKKKT